MNMNMQTCGFRELRLDQAALLLQDSFQVKGNPGVVLLDLTTTYDGVDFTI